MRRRWRIAVAVAAAALISGAVAFWLTPIPRALLASPRGTLTLLDIRGREIATIATTEARAQTPLSLAQMGADLPRLTVALEDRRFYAHRGIDWTSALSATARNIRAGHIVSGASTITQQLVKMATGRQHRSWRSKIYETVMAWKLERTWSKQRILAEYLNRSSYGNRRLGPEAAAGAYFGKHTRDLSLAETIYLAGLPQAPTRLNPWRHPENAGRKFERSVARLAERGAITPEQRNLCAGAPPTIAAIPPPHMAPHFVAAFVAAHPQLRGTAATTLDLDLQKMLEGKVCAHLAALHRSDLSEAAAVIVENETGAIRALVGSHDWAQAQVNGATTPRSCGSTLKPFVYLAALEQRKLTAASILPDTPDAIHDAYADYDPQNYNHRFLGPVRLREALACSLNVPAVYTVSQLGARPIFQRLRRWGFNFPRTLSDYGAGFVLGNAETRLVDLASAYAGLARGGIALPARMSSGQAVASRRLASPEASAIITDILCDNEARAKSFGLASPLAFAERIAVKTGTSSGFRDAWTVGFNKTHTVAVWAGNFDGHPMRDTFAVRAAAPLWANVMRELLRHDAPLDPPVLSEKLLRSEVCADTGLQPSPSSKATISELFLAGTEPRVSSAAYFDETGKLLLPAQYAIWCASRDNADGASVRAELRITCPAPGSRFEIDPALPATQQMIELRATPGRDVRWFVNGQPQTARHDGRVLWQLAPGEWKLMVRGESGTAEQTITVLE